MALNTYYTQYTGYDTIANKAFSRRASIEPAVHVDFFSYCWVMTCTVRLRRGWPWRQGPQAQRLPTDRVCGLAVACHGRKWRLRRRQVTWHGIALRLIADLLEGTPCVIMEPLSKPPIRSRPIPAWGTGGGLAVVDRGVRCVTIHRHLLGPVWF